MGSAKPEAENGIRQPGDEQARLRDDQISLQSVMIELLNTQLREARARLDSQAEEIAELKRLIRVRDDLLYLKNSERQGDHGLWRWLPRWLTGPRRD